MRGGGRRFSRRNREQKLRHPHSHCRRRLRAVVRRPEKKIPSVPVGIFLARHVLRRDTARARAPVGRSSLCDDENYAGGGGRVFRRIEDDDNYEVTPLPQRRSRPCMGILGSAFSRWRRLCPALNIILAATGFPKTQC